MVTCVVPKAIVIAESIIFKMHSDTTAASIVHGTDADSAARRTPIQSVSTSHVARVVHTGTTHDGVTTVHHVVSAVGASQIIICVQIVLISRAMIIVDVVPVGLVSRVTRHIYDCAPAAISASIA